MTMLLLSNRRKQRVFVSLTVVARTILTIMALIPCNQIEASSTTSSSTIKRRIVLNKPSPSQQQQQNNHKQTMLLHGPPISLRSGWNKFWKIRWYKASAVAELEQSVEDYNTDYVSTCRTVAESTRHRRLIVLPLDDRFNPPVGVFSHNHIQTGDKVCMPSCFWQAIQLNQAEVPWLFTIKRIPGVTSEPRVQLIQPKRIVRQIESDDDDDQIYEEIEEEVIVSEYKPYEELDQLIAGPLDFRSPPCYIFIPLWMMRSLGLRPRDIVQVDMIETIPPGSLAKLRPHSSDFAKDISNPQAVLETELRHYSSLTCGTTIAFDYNKKRYWFDVVEVRSAPRGEKQQWIKVQDCDIATDFLPAKDTLQKKKRKKKRPTLKENK